MQDGGGGRKEKMSLGTIQNEFAMRFSVNQSFHSSATKYGIHYFGKYQKKPRLALRARQNMFSKRI